ncbi:MAG: DALR domain-containing protein, partial [Arsenophonus sp. NC-QC1-MAG3]
LNFFQYSLKQARAALERLYTALRDTDNNNIKSINNEIFKQRFIQAMNDDFNTPDAYSVLFDLVKEINRLKVNDMAMANGLAVQLRQLTNILGLLTQNPEQFLQNQVQVSRSIDVEKIKILIKKRNNARENKLWAQADLVRDQLTKMGIILEDSPQGTVWRYK